MQQQSIRHFFQIITVAILLSLTKVATAGDVPMLIINYAGEPAKVNVCWFENWDGYSIWKCENYDIGKEGYISATIPVGSDPLPLNVNPNADFRAYCKKADGTSVSNAFYDGKWGDDIKVIKDGWWPVCRKLN